MNLTIFIENLNWLVSNKWSIPKESMYALILKGLLIHVLKFFSVLIPGGCPVALLPILVGFRYNYLYLSFKVVKLKTKFHSPNFKSNSGVFYYFIKLYKWRNRHTLDIVGNLNAHTARNYSTLATPRCSVDNFKLDPWWIIGFMDGEGCFDVSIIENKKLNQGWEIQHRFAIVLHVKDKALLQEIQSYLGVGKIYKHGPESLQFLVTSFKELDTVINHFKKYPLITKKCADCQLSMLVG